jgi:hypothetical protein
MSNQAVVTARRNQIAQRWLRNESASSIAAARGLPVGTIKHDLDSIRKNLIDGQGEALRLARAKAIAGAEQVIAKSWERLVLLEAQPAADQDERAIGAYLTLILKAQAQLARLAGVLVGKPSFVVQRVVNDGLSQYADGLEKARSLAETRAWMAEHDFMDEDLEDEETQGEEASPSSGEDDGTWQSAARQLEHRYPEQWGSPHDRHR